MSYPYELDNMYNSEKPSADGLGRLSFGTSSGGNKGKRVWRSPSFQVTKTPLYLNDEDGLHPVEGTDIETVSAYFTLDVSDSIYNEFFINNALPVFNIDYDNDSETNKFGWGGDIVGEWSIADGPSGYVFATLTSSIPGDYIYDAEYISKTLDIYSATMGSENKYNIVGKLKINCYVNGKLNTDTSYVPVNTNDGYNYLRYVPIFLVSNDSLMDTIFNSDVDLFEYSIPLEYYLNTLEEPYQGIYPYYKSLPDLAEAIVGDLQEGDLTVDQCLDLLRNHLFTVMYYNANAGIFTGYMWKIENDTLYVNEEYKSILVFDKPVQE